VHTHLRSALGVSLWFATICLLDYLIPLNMFSPYLNMVVPAMVLTGALVCMLVVEGSLVERVYRTWTVGLCVWGIVAFSSFLLCTIAYYKDVPGCGISISIVSRINCLILLDDPAWFSVASYVLLIACLSFIASIFIALFYGGYALVERRHQTG
jgi:hypothetical protein